MPSYLNEANVGAGSCVTRDSLGDGEGSVFAESRDLEEKCLWTERYDMDRLEILRDLGLWGEIL